jgi:hypothetical protein
MTSLAFMLARCCRWSGVGRWLTSQRAISTGVIGGMLTGTVLAVRHSPIFCGGSLFLLFKAASPERQPFSPPSRRDFTQPAAGSPPIGADTKVSLGKPARIRCAWALHGCGLAAVVPSSRCCRRPERRAKNA